MRRARIITRYLLLAIRWVRLAANHLPQTPADFPPAAGRVALALALLAQSAGEVRGQQEPRYQWPRSHDYDVQHYRLVVSFDWSKKAISGQTTITCRPFKSGFTRLDLDAGEMTINQVRMADGGPLTFSYEGNEKLLVNLGRPYAAGEEIAVTVDYSAAPKRGLTFVMPTEHEPSRPFQIWSQGETELNHYWFPCYDHPNDRATSELIATVEEKYHVISNGTLVQVLSDGAAKTRTWHWKMDKPFPSYLISIVVGEFAEVTDRRQGIPITSYVYRNQVENARLSFAKLPNMLEFFAEKLHYPYPYAKYAQVTVRDFIGGMENITATTLEEKAVYDARSLLDSSPDNLLAHELAHQWLGNMLTCRGWNDLWLNEGFATLFANLWTEHDKGSDEYLYAIYKDQEKYFEAWRQGNRRPLSATRFDDPEALFDAVTYQRAASVLAMMRFILGEEMFLKAVRHYVRKHAWQSVETQELVIAIEEATGQNLQWFFDQWVYKMGHLEAEVSTSFDEAGRALKLKVRQTQKPDHTRPWYQAPESYRVPVDIAITTASGERVHRVLIDRPEQEFTFPVDSRPLIVNFDRGNYVIKLVKQERSHAELAYQLLHDFDVTGRLRAAAELKTTRSDQGIAALSEAAVKDRFWGVRLEAVEGLGTLKAPEARPALLQAARDREARVRRAAVKALGALNDSKMADLFIDLTRSDPSYGVVGQAALALAQTGDSRAFEVLATLIKQDSWEDTIRSFAVAGLAVLKDPRSLDIAIEFARPGRSASVRVWSFELLGRVGKGNDRALEVLSSAMREPYQPILLNAAGALGAIGDLRALPALEEFVKREDSPPSSKSYVLSVINRLKARTSSGLFPALRLNRTSLTSSTSRLHGREVIASPLVAPALAVFDVRQAPGSLGRATSSPG